MSDLILHPTRATGGRPPFEPTPTQRQVVIACRACGVPADAIAHELGIDRKTLQKYFADEMKHGKGRMVIRIGTKLLQKAMQGDIRAMIHYLNRHGGEPWQESHRLIHTGPGGGPVQPPNLIVTVLPPPPKDDALA